jgi:hypothetical protein
MAHFIDLDAGVSEQFPGDVGHDHAAPEPKDYLGIGVD